MNRLYKRCLAWVLALSLLACLGVLPAAAVEDTTPPVIHSVSITQKVVVGETITLTLNGEDDVSGIRVVFVDYRSADGRLYSLTFTNPGSSQSFTATIPAPLAMEPGKWKAELIAVYDNAENCTSYAWNGAAGPVDFSKLDLTVADNPDKDCVAPMLHGLRVKNSLIKAPAEVKFEAEITDNYPGELQATLYIYVGNFRDAANLTYNPSTGKYEGSLYIDLKDKNKKITFESLFIVDPAGNMVSYTTQDPTQVTGTDIILRRIKDEWIPRITISNGVKDTSPPKLLDYSYEKERVYAPAAVDFSMNIQDADPEGVEALIGFVHERDGKTNFICYTGLRHVEGTLYAAIGPLTIDQYTEPGSVYINRIELTDSSGNRSIYTVDGSQGTRLEKKTFQVVSSRNPDLTTGTTVAGYLDKIRASADDAVIVLDCTGNSLVPAEVFAAIRGTGRTLILNHEGIEWIFTGGDLPNADKDIDCAVSYEVFRGWERDDTLTDEEVANDPNARLAGLLQNKPALLIKFAPNGTLPGPAIVRIKAEYTFRNVIGISDLDAYFYNEQAGKLDAIEKNIEMAEDGYYAFAITHNSTYLLAPQKQAVQKPSGGGNSTQPPAVPGGTETTETAPSPAESTSPAGSPFAPSSQPSSAAETQPAGDKDTDAAAVSPENRGDGWIIVLIVVGVLVIAAAAVLAVPQTRNKLLSVLHRAKPFPADAASDDSEPQDKAE